MENLATRRLLGKVAQCLLLVAALAVPSMAKRHPVPLDPNTDSAKCVECHQDKTKGASVHTAMSMGCNSCHEVRVIKSRDKKHPDVTRVKLIKATATSQCITCHDNIKTSAGNSVVHAPVTRNCLTCHDPHVSAYKNQLKKTVSGGKDENLCLACHGQGLNVPAKGSRHAAIDMGCDTCHVTHKTGEADKRDNRFHLTKDAPALCLDCHDVKDKKLAEAHHNQPIATADCLACHEAHQSARPKLAQRFLHQPFEAGACDSCHSEPKDGKVVLV
ncbi:MAG TPA: cytochrome c3 family protein, partial [Terriglobales bacterium]|nr:cytochrome c3 family protein [Terriglobales bacterium]